MKTFEHGGRVYQIPERQGGAKDRQEAECTKVYCCVECIDIECVDCLFSDRNGIDAFEAWEKVQSAKPLDTESTKERGGE